MNRTIDLHGCTKEETKQLLDRIIRQNPGSLELTLIHGYSSPVLQQYVRGGYRNRRIKKRILTLNPGETILWIKGKDE